MSETIRVRSKKTKFIQLEHDLHDYLGVIGSHGYVVYSILEKYANFDTGRCYPKIATIAATMCVSRATVHTALADLVTAKLVAVTSGSETGKHNEYTLLPIGGGVSGLTGVSAGQQGVSAGQHPNKEELEPSNNNQLTLSPPSSEKISKKKKQVDPRHAPFKELIFRCYRYMNQQSDPPWGPGDAKQLSALLTETPRLTEQQFRHWLANYSKSEDITRSARPSCFLPRISNYGSGPRDEWHRVKLQALRDDGPTPGEILRNQLAEENKRKGLM